MNYGNYNEIIKEIYENIKINDNNIIKIINFNIYGKIIIEEGNENVIKIYNLEDTLKILGNFFDKEDIKKYDIIKNKKIAVIQTIIMSEIRKENNNIDLFKLVLGKGLLDLLVYLSIYRSIIMNPYNTNSTHDTEKDTLSVKGNDNEFKKIISLLKKYVEKK